MKIRTDFVTNSSSSSYILAKRLVIEDYNGCPAIIPIEVSHTVEGENANIYFVDGSYRLYDEILRAALIDINNGDLINDVPNSLRDTLNNNRASEFVNQFWRNEADIIRRFYKDESWRIEESNFETARDQIEKYCIFGEKNDDGKRYFDEWDYQCRVYDMYFLEKKESRHVHEPTFSAHNVRNKDKFSYFNKYVRGVSVYLYNTEYKDSLAADADSIFAVAQVMLAASFENAAEIAKGLRDKSLYPILIGVLPQPGTFPDKPTDIWLLELNPEHKTVDDMFSVELAELENWLSAYTPPVHEESLWESIQRFIEQNSTGREFYTIKKSKYREGSDLYLQYWDDLESPTDEDNFDFDGDDLSCEEQKDEPDQKSKNALSALSKDELLNVRIEDFDLSVRSYNTLKRAGMDTVDDIIGKSEAELMTVRNFSKKCLEEVSARLRLFGLGLAKPDEV